MKPAIIGILLSTILMGSKTFADFGEIDLVVHESIENVFLELGRKVDMSTLEYFGDPKMTDSIMTIETSVWAFQEFTHEMGIHDCVTRIEVLQRGVFRDLGSECIYEHDR